MSMDRWKREQLKHYDEARLTARADRAQRTRVHSVIPGEFFAAASSECRDVFIDGHFYACISLSQAVAEGLTRYMADVHKLGAQNDIHKRVERLLAKGAITRVTADAFRRIWGNDRNTFHHLNRDVPTDCGTLEQRAEECIGALYEAESDAFACDVINGKLAPKRPEYWRKTDAEHMAVFLRALGH